MFSQGDVAVGRITRLDVARVLVSVLDGDNAPAAAGKTMEVLALSGATHTHTCIHTPTGTNKHTQKYTDVNTFIYIHKHIYTRTQTLTHSHTSKHFLEMYMYVHTPTLARKHCHLIHNKFSSITLLS